MRGLSSILSLFRGLSSILSLFRNEFNKFNKKRARILYSIYHMTLRILNWLFHGDPYIVRFALHYMHAVKIQMNLINNAIIQLTAVSKIT